MPSDTQSDFLATARERFRLAAEAEREIRHEALLDLKFVAGDQWDPNVKRERELAKRPALTFNKIHTFVAQVANDSRQNRPAIKISPSTNVTKEVADVARGAVRHIESDSDADVAYATAIEYAVSCGFGYYRVLTEYCAEDSFDQDIKIERIDDPFTVYCDPLAKKADRSDARYYFILSEMSKDEFRQTYPKAECSRNNFFEDSYQDSSDWIQENTVRIAEYWYVEYEERKLHAYADGTIAFADQAQGKAKPVRTRIVQVPQVKCARINGFEILDDADTLGTPWPGQWIPIVPVLGREMIVEGKRLLFSLVRFQRDPQQLYNYYKTTIAETLAQTPRNPFIGVEGQFAGHEAKWATAHLVNRAYLEYKNVTINGTPAPAPQRQVFEPPVQALSMGALQESDDMKACAGMFDAALGAKSNETSGVAIDRRQKESDNANYHFQDNLARSQRHCGRIIVDLFPKIYDTAREILILGEDYKQEVVRVNEQYLDEKTQQPKHYDLSLGKYTVTVETGPSYKTQRQEAFDRMTQFAQAYPALLQIAGDIVFRNSDMPGADQLADRFEKTLPPQLQDAGEGQQAIPPQIQQKLAEQGQLIEHMTTALKAETQARETNALKMAHDERMKSMQIRADLIKTFASQAGSEAMQIFQMEMQQLNQQLAQAGAESEPQAA